MSSTEGLYAAGDLFTESFEFIRMLGSGLPFGGVMNWGLIAVGVGIILWWLKQMSQREEKFEANKPS